MEWPPKNNGKKGKEGKNGGGEGGRKEEKSGVEQWYKVEIQGVGMDTHICLFAHVHKLYLEGYIRNWLQFLSQDSGRREICLSLYSKKMPLEFFSNLFLSP